MYIKKVGKKGVGEAFLLGPSHLTISRFVFDENVLIFAIFLEYEKPNEKTITIFGFFVLCIPKVNEYFESFH